MTKIVKLGDMFINVDTIAWVQKRAHGTVGVVTIGSGSFTLEGKEAQDFLRFMDEYNSSIDTPTSHDPFGWKP